MIWMIFRLFCDELIVIDKGKIILQESMDVILSKFSDFKYLKIKMTLDLVPELCSVKGVVVISQNKIGMYTKNT